MVIEMKDTIDSERKREKECYHEFAAKQASYQQFYPRNNEQSAPQQFPKVCLYPLSTDVDLLQFHYEHTGHAYAISADHACAYLTSPVADEDL